MTPAHAHWLDVLLEDNLRPVAAPAGLWDRLWRPRLPQPKSSLIPGLAFGAAAVVAAALIAAVALPPARHANSQQALRSSDPAEIRAWVKNCTGLDVPLAQALPPSIQLVEARTATQEPRAAEIVFRLDGRETVLNVSAAPAAKPVTIQMAVHRQGQRTWQARGVSYELKGNAVGLEAACRLCHAAL